MKAFLSHSSRNKTIVEEVAEILGLANVELPLGMITSLVGGPFFFYLLRRTRSRQGGWA